MGSSHSDRDIILVFWATPPLQNFKDVKYTGVYPLQLRGHSLHAPLPLKRFLECPLTAPLPPTRFSARSLVSAQCSFWSHIWHVELAILHFVNDLTCDTNRVINKKINKNQRGLRYLTSKNAVTSNSGLRSLKVIENDTFWYTACVCRRSIVTGSYLGSFLS